MVVDRQIAQLEAQLLGEDEPGNEVGVVLHLGEQDRVPLPEMVAPPRLCDQVERLGGVLGEDDLAPGHRRADEAADLGPGLGEQPVGLLGDGVEAAMDVGIARLVVRIHRLEDGAGLLRRGRGVQIDQAGALTGTVEDRKVGPEEPSVDGADPVDQARHAS